MPAVQNTAGARPVQQPSANDAAKAELKRPQENSAAKQAPKETRAAVKNTFGGVPKNTDDSKLPVTLPAPASPKSNNLVLDTKAQADNTDGSGNPVVYDEMGKPVLRQDLKTPDGLQIYKDATSGELEVSVPNGPVYRVDPATNDIAKDVDGNYLPALYDPVNSDETRPPVMPNENPDKTTRNLPQGKDRGDPMQIKGKLFDKNGNLSNENLYNALAKYDTRDVYDALINAGNAGGWDNMPPSPKLVHPDESKAKQAIAALIAWQNENGKYSPIRDGKVPAIVFEDRAPWEMQHENRDANSLVINVNTDRPISAAAFQGLNKLKMSETFGAIYNGSGNPPLDTVAEYLANNWTGNTNDMKGELNLKWEYRQMDRAVLALGNGDRNAGLDKLKRAYYTGDPVAIRELNQRLSESRGS